MSPLEGALALAGRGWPVFPCSPKQEKPGSKAPLTARESAPGARDGGLYLATCDADQIRAWWRRWPGALVGLRTGAAAGLFVVDLDPRAAAAADMVRALGRWFGGFADRPGTDVVAACTQSGGVHLYFAWPALDEGERLGNRADLFKGVAEAPPALATHVDVRGDGGYVIAPPSMMIDGAAYRWIGREVIDVTPCACPPRLLDLILRRRSFGRPAPTPPVLPFRVPAGRAGDLRAAYGRAALGRIVALVATAAKGTRNATLNEQAFALGRLVGAGAIEAAAAFAALRAAAAACGHLAARGARSVDDTIARGLRDGAASPADLSHVGQRRVP
jgi:putative DNA primase/helicase